MVLVHDPFVATPDSRSWDDPTVRYQADTSYFNDMMAYTDKIVGRIMDQLEQSGLAENTLVIFTGDNGTNRNIVSRMDDGRRIRGGKGTMTDAGTRVPLIAYWKGKSASGAVNADLVDFSDFLPTLAEAADIPIADDQRIDGQSFLPQILGKPGKPKEYVYLYYKPLWLTFENGVFVRDQRYKLYGDGRFYAIAEDVLEQNPIPLTKLQGEASQAATKLQNVLHQMPDID